MRDNQGKPAIRNLRTASWKGKEGTIGIEMKPSMFSVSCK